MHCELGLIEGRVKIVDGNVLVVDRVSRKATLCQVDELVFGHLQRDNLEGARVAVYGRVTTDDCGNPIVIDVRKLIITLLPENLPQMEDLHGIDITGGEPSEDYVRRMRDDTDD